MNLKLSQYLFQKNKIKRLLFGKSSWSKVLNNVREEDLVVYQYPAYSRILGDYFINEASKKKLFKIIVIHDLDSLRIYKDSPKDIEREINFLNNFDVIICHNKSMENWLLKNGCTSSTEILGIFDYFEHLALNTSENWRDVIFAGNLGKSKFLEKLDMQTQFNIYGIEPSEKYPINIDYKGAYKPEELGAFLSGGFGLVWDGESIDTCTGMTGEYMKFNNPHKTSLYLAMGIPVIILKNAALADFVLSNNVGIVVESLSELDKKICEISKEEYKIIKNNAIEMAEKLRTGTFIKSAVTKAVLN